jgi:hypothetical protein
MNRHQIRNLKSHYLSRWAVMRYNQKNQNKIVLLEDQFVLKNLAPGTTLFYNCLGEIYQGIVNGSTSQRYNNLVLINNLEFKYKSVDEINAVIQNLAEQFLTANGRIIFSVDHKFLCYNRFELSVTTLLANWFANFKKFKVTHSLNLLGKANSGYGTYFFCVDYA